MKRLFRFACLMIVLTLFVGLAGGVQAAAGGDAHAIRNNDPLPASTVPPNPLPWNPAPPSAPPSAPPGGDASGSCRKLGHSYLATVLSEPTCTEEGRTQFVCRRCGYTSIFVYDPLGHEYAESVVEPTCTGEGRHVFTCERCEDSYFEPIPALGHDMQVTADTQPDCTHDGEYTERCTRCDYYTAEVRPATGHDFGEWVTVAEPTLKSEGRQERYCTRCDKTESQSLPKKTLGDYPAILGGIILLGGGGGCAGLVALSRARWLGRAAARAAAKNGLGMITLKMQALMLELGDSPEEREFEELLRQRAYLDIKKPGDPAPEGGEEGKKEKVALVIISPDSAVGLSSRVTEASERFDAPVAVICGDDVLEDVLKTLKEQGTLFAYARRGDSAERKLLRLIMPLYSLKENSGNFAENATLLTDALGLPVLSTILNLYVVGGDVSDAVKARGDMGTADLSDMVNDVAGLFGLDALANWAEALRVGADQTERVKDKKKAGEPTPSGEE